MCRLVTKNTDKQPRRLFVFSYPGQPDATVNVVVETLKKAQRGRANAQKSLLFQYKKAAGIGKEVFLNWKNLKLETHSASLARQSKS
jgi:hypothetical protein